MVLILTVAGMAMGFSFDKTFLFLKFLSVLLAIIQLPVWINRFHDVNLPAAAFLAPGMIYWLVIYYLQSSLIDANTIIYGGQTIIADPSAYNNYLIYYGVASFALAIYYLVVTLRPSYKGDNKWGLYEL